jgi:hypothetical protein
MITILYSFAYESYYIPLKGPLPDLYHCFNVAFLGSSWWLTTQMCIKALFSCMNFEYAPVAIGAYLK